MSVCVCVCVTHRDVTGFHVRTKHDDKYAFELCEFKSFAALACWDCGFESRRRHECLVSGVYFVLSLLRADPSSRGALPNVCVSMSVIRRNNNRQQQTEEVRLRQKQRNTKLTFSRITPRVVFSQRRKACGHKLNKIHYGTGRKEKKEKRRCGPHNMTHYRPVNETGTQSVTREFFISSTSRHSGCYHSLSVSIRKYELVPRILA